MGQRWGRRASPAARTDHTSRRSGAVPLPPLRTVGETLATHPEIAFAAVTGDGNLVVGGIFRDPAALYDYIDRRIGALPGIQCFQTAPTLREVKRMAPAVR
ncbi:Lrp/AsnC ligand binding domain-containing protein [Streptomyces arenae]|nr:Lrp/AsnC ligand binding domain-containing protein [Streptomyces arenae]